MQSPRPDAFGELLRHYRRAAGLTQEALGERAGLSTRGVSDLERGVNRTPQPGTLRLLAEALGLVGDDRASFIAAARRPRGSFPPAPTSALPRRPTASTPLVGRRDDLAQLERHLRGEGPPALLLAGEPGIGKTRLLRQAAARAWADGWEVLEGGCQRRDAQGPYAPLLGALAQHLAPQTPAQLHAHLPGCAWLVRLLPELAERAVVPLPQWALPPEQERRLLFAAVGRYLANVAGPCGTLLVLDDLQWAGQDGLDLLASLLGPASAPPLRVVGAYRSTEVRPADPLGMLVADLARAGLVAQLDVAPLAPAEAAALVASLLAPDDEHSPEPLPETGARLVERAGGVPYFLVSGARALAAGAAPEVPWDVGQSIRQRVAALPVEAQQLLGAAAVAGRVVGRALLAAVVEQAEGEVLVGLRATSQARLLVEASADEYTFAHDLVREVVEAALSAGERRMWHRRLAVALEQRPEPKRTRRAAELAHHFAQAGEGARAFPYALAAGDEAQAVYALAEAERHYQMARDLAQAHGDRATEAAALDRLAWLSMWGTGRYASALELFEQAVEAYRATGDLEGQVRTSVQLARVYARSGGPRQGLAQLAPLLETLESAGEHELSGAPRAYRAALLVALADVHYHSGSYEQQVETAERAAELARVEEQSSALAEALNLRGIALGLLGRCEDAVRTLQEAITLAEETGDIYTCSHALRHLADVYERNGQFAAAGEAIARGLELAERLGHVTQVGIMAYRRGLHAYYLGEWEDMRARYERAEVLFTQVKREMPQAYAPLTYSYAPFVRGHLALITGEREVGVRHLEEAATLSTNNRNLHVMRKAHRELAGAWAT